MSNERRKGEENGVKEHYAKWRVEHEALEVLR